MKMWAFIPLVLVTMLLSAGSALALDMEYYTYGGFNPIVQAFVRIALIFSDASYQGLIFVMTVIGIMAGAAAWIARATTGARIIPLTWTVPVVFRRHRLFGRLLFPRAISPSMTQVLTRFQTVGDIPDGIVFTARDAEP
jgi:hypothetical protein